MGTLIGNSPVIQYKGIQFQNTPLWLELNVCMQWASQGISKHKTWFIFYMPVIMSVYISLSHLTKPEFPKRSNVHSQFPKWHKESIADQRIQVLEVHFSNSQFRIGLHKAKMPSFLNARLKPFSLKIPQAKLRRMTSQEFI